MAATAEAAQAGGLQARVTRLERSNKQLEEALSEVALSEVDRLAREQAARKEAEELRARLLVLEARLGAIPPARVSGRGSALPAVLEDDDEPLIARSSGEEATPCHVD
jgi:hypothetical protein